jgi:DNA-binding GntR family transcriptional regulator
VTSGRARAGGSERAEALPAGAGLADHVYQLLKAEVINDQFPSGERIVIETVATRLRVSPTPVREALAKLAGEQLVAFRAYVGYSALPPLSLAELNDLFEAREVIECAAAIRACERATDNDLVLLREIDARIRAGHYGKDRYSEFAAFVNDNQRFHEILIDAARNPELRRALDSLNYEARIARRTRGRGIPDLSLICDEHTAIIEALSARDADALVAAVAGHARESHRRLVEDLRRNSGS